MRNPLFRLLRMSEQSFWVFVVGIVIRAVGETGVQIIFIFLMRDVFASMIELSPAILFGGLTRAALTFVVTLSVFMLGFILLQRQVASITARMRRDLFAKLHRLPVSYFKHNHSGDTVSRMTNDVNAVVALLNELPSKFLFESFTFLASITIIFWVDYRLGMVALAAGGIGALANASSAKKLRTVSRNLQDSQSRLTSLLSDLFGGIAVIKSFSLYAVMNGALSRHNGDVRRHGLERVRTQATLEGANFITSSLNVMGLLLVGAVLHLRGEVSIPDIVMVIQAQGGVDRLFRGLGAHITGLQSSLAAAERVCAVLDATAEPDSYSDMLAHHSLSSTAVAMRGVSFAYDRQTQVLTDVSLTVQYGEKVALVGPSGGGKSTLLKLLLAWYAPDLGTIAVAGRTLSEQTLAEARAEMSYVPQDAHLFSGTIADNIRMGKPDASEAEVAGAAKAAQAHDFIMALEHGFKTQVGEKGGQLSGGQRQRIAIARAILRDAPILLLDEATASLDTESEVAVHAALDRLMQNRTVIVVAHRLSTVENTDRILVLDGGRIVEEGTHTELMHRGELYQELRQTATLCPANSQIGASRPSCRQTQWPHVGRG